MEKLILVFYINVAGKSTIRAKETIASFTNNYSGKIPGAIEYFIPLGEADKGSTRLEVINPANINISEMQDKVNEIIHYINTQTDKDNG
jgi:hypothetical protein